jgi:hypothetical protein
MIIEFPRDSNEWYILRCDEHGVRFKTNVLLGAAKHLGGDEHGGMLRSDADSVRLLGIKVRNCNAELAEKNNHVFRQAQHQPSQRGKVDQSPATSPTRHTQRGTSGRKRTRRTENTPPGDGTDREDEREEETPAAGAEGEEKTAFEGITSAVAGEMYRGLWKPTRTWYVVLILPMGKFNTVGLSGNADMRRLGYIPKCYRSDPRSKTILGWEDGFKDGGPHVTKRKFPVMYFARDEYEPLGSDIPELPQGSNFGWMESKNLRPFDFDDPGCRGVAGYGAARGFSARLLALGQKDGQPDAQPEQALQEQAPRKEAQRGQNAPTGDHGQSAGTFF